MALEVNISVIESSLQDHNLPHDELANDPVTSQRLYHESNKVDNNTDSGHLRAALDIAVLDSFHGSTSYPKEEENNGNTISSPCPSYKVCAQAEVLGYDADVTDNENNRCDDLASNSKSYVIKDSCSRTVSSPVTTEEAVRHVATTSVEKSVLFQASTSISSKPGDRISRNNSFHGPVITTIRIDTPVKRSSSMDSKSLQTSQVECTISVPRQSNVTFQMTNSPSLQRPSRGNGSSSYVDTPNKKLPLHQDLAGEICFFGRDIQVGNPTARQRGKENANTIESATKPYPSQTEKMKRHSAEISQLRHMLEQKISRGSSCRNSPRETRHTVSDLGYLRLCDSPTRENKRLYDYSIYTKKSLSHTSSPGQWRKNARKTVHVTDAPKVHFLLEGHQRSNDQHASNVYEYKITTGSIEESIRSPKHYCNSIPERNSNTNYNPYTTLRCSTTPFYDSEATAPTQDSTSSLGPPGPNSLQESEKKNEEPTPKTDTQVMCPLRRKMIPEDDGRVNYYPNCDATIWLRSCKKEVIEPLSGALIGQVPLWLSGTLVRNGPGRLEVGDHKYNHLFDGSALLHRFHFSQGNVTYQNRFLKSRSYLRDTKAQRIVVNYFGTRAHPDPCRTILQNIASKFEFEEHFTDNAQISLYPYGDGLYALTETPFIFRVDPETLDTHEKVDLTRYISVLTHTAHPHVDRDGTVYNIGQGVGPLGPKYHICKFPNSKTNKKGKSKSPFDQVQIMGSVGARWRFNPCYMHSFAMTENYWVIIEQPLVVSVSKVLKVVLRKDAMIDALQWWEKETKIHVVRRTTGSTITTQFVSETFFFLHTINAYEDRGHVVLDIATYRNAEMLNCMYVEALKNASYDPTYAQMFRGRPKRWVLPLRPSKDASVGTNLVTLPDTKCQGRWLKKNVVYLTPELLADIGCEVPRIYYEKYNGRSYRYFYAICSDVDHQPNPGTLVKVDVAHKTHVEWSEDNVYPSEPIFAPHPHAKNEDDGVIMSALLRAKGLNNQVCMLILDASTFREIARVEFVAPGPVPKCLHGWFVPEGSLRVHP